MFGGLMRLAIAAGGDEKFVLPLAVTLFSALTHLRQGVGVDLFIIDGGMKPSSIDRLRAILEPFSSHTAIHLVAPRLDILQRRQLPMGRHGAMTYLRLLLPDSLPPSVERVLYLDSDLLIRDSLDELWNEVNWKTAIAGVPDYSAPLVSSDAALPNWEELGLPPKAPYINAGVLVMNLRLWRSNNYSEAILEYNTKYRRLNRYADQDGINAVLCCSCQALDTKWNVPAYIEFDRLVERLDPSPTKGRVKANPRELIEHGSILHFIGSRKPWTLGLASRTQDEWLQCMRETGWFRGRYLSYLRTALPLRLDWVLRKAVRGLRHK
jgi:lipopolysaccharide biosynthesis glycosyltransferase